MERLEEAVVQTDHPQLGPLWALQTPRSAKPFRNPLNYYARLPLRPDDVVADIGAYVGEYARFALLQGAGRVDCYEPTPFSFRLLRMNRRPGMVLHNVAVVGDERTEVDLYLSSGIGVTNSIAKTDRKAGKITVPAVPYAAAVAGATVVKIDVEGAEYGYPILQPGLRGIILEFHPLTDQPWREMAGERMAQIEAAGYRPLCLPTFRSGWDLTGVWERPGG